MMSIQSTNPALVVPDCHLSNNPDINGLMNIMLENDIKFPVTAAGIMTLLQIYSADRASNLPDEQKLSHIRQFLGHQIPGQQQRPTNTNEENMPTSPTESASSGESYDTATDTMDISDPQKRVEDKVDRGFTIVSPDSVPTPDPATIAHISIEISDDSDNYNIITTPSRDTVSSEDDKIDSFDEPLVFGADDIDAIEKSFANHSFFDDDRETSLYGSGYDDGKAPLAAIDETPEFDAAAFSTDDIDHHESGGAAEEKEHDSFDDSLHLDEDELDELEKSFFTPEHQKIDFLHNRKRTHDAVPDSPFFLDDEKPMLNGGTSMKEPLQATAAAVEETINDNAAHSSSAGGNTCIAEKNNFLDTSLNTSAISTTSSSRRFTGASALGKPNVVFVNEKIQPFVTGTTSRSRDTVAAKKVQSRDSVAESRPRDIAVQSQPRHTVAEMTRPHQVSAIPAASLSAGNTSMNQSGFTTANTSVISTSEGGPRRRFTGAAAAEKNRIKEEMEKLQRQQQQQF